MKTRTKKYEMHYSDFHGGAFIGWAKGPAGALRTARRLQGDCECNGCVVVTDADTGEIISRCELESTIVIGGVR